MKIKKAVSVLLAAVLALCAFPCLNAGAVTAHEWDHELKTECNGECGQNPVIVVPGIMQSQTYVTDKDGNLIMTSEKTPANDYRGYPILEGMDMSFMFDTNEIKSQIKDAVPDMLKAVAKRNRDELLDILIGILDSGFSAHYFNPDGTRVNGAVTDEYWYSLEECKNHPDRSYNFAKGYGEDKDGNALPTTKYENEYDFIFRQVDISAFCNKYGYDHAYYYSYGSFGNMFEAAEKLNEYIEMVKCQTGHSKVNLVFISLGGTIGNIFLSEYANPDDLDRVIFAAAATDGSYLLSDLMDDRTTFDNGYCLYNDLIPNIVQIAAEEYMALAYLGNTLARAIPQEVFSDFLEEALRRAIDEVLAKLIRNCQSMWALVPSAEYPAMAEKYLSDADHSPLKELTDRYYNIQLNAKNVIRKTEAQGVDIFCITGYNLQLPAAVEHYNISADQIIQASSTSIGATFAPLGSSFDSSYTPAIDETYLNRERTVDAGTCALPDRTWFVKNQSHLKLQSAVNDVIGLCVSLLTDKSITDARINNGGYPQFTEYRDLREIESLMRRYNEKDFAGKNEAVDKAYADAVALLANRDWKASETEEVEQELYAAMKKAKQTDKGSDSVFVKYKLVPFFETFFRRISDLFTKVFKGNDYWLFFIPLI